MKTLYLFIIFAMISLTSSIRFLGDRIEQIESCYQGCRLKGCRVTMNIWKYHVNVEHVKELEK